MPTTARAVRVAHFDLPALPYAYDALEPVISKETLEFHHDKHHRKYFDTMNQLLEKENVHAASLEDVVKHVVHHATSAGGPEHVGIGTDLDGGFDARYAPLDDVSKLKVLRARLRLHFNQTQVDGIMGGNWLSFLERSLPEK